MCNVSDYFSIIMSDYFIIESRNRDRASIDDYVIKM
jgi:hypothetical protein